MKRPDLSDTTVRRCGLAAVVLAVASVPLAPLNSLARMRTPDGRSDLENPMAAWWAEPAMDAVGPRLLDFAGASTVYLTYGKFNLLAVLAVLACAVAALSRRPGRLGRIERWGWRLTLTSLAVMCAGQLVVYWLGVVDEGYLVVLLAMLVGIFGNALLGLGLVRSGFRPRPAAWAVLLNLPLSVALVSVATQATGMWPMMLAWGLIGWSLWRDPARRPARTTVRGTAPVGATRRA
ncbi:hypothetical protein HN031_03665 [Nocardioides sp. zg-1308]|uniref:hypothetical protein n=1 Tax=Nocardioides sp. zg-1308 TaxID=2736253 RepID=UPI001556F5EB|nr:hypothetical protein [Nocardioides sp. zg-1308]NPD03781.1 hypothetical protein [Nocardioides sp. zg-1308]